jgi:hypothetical protein
MSGDDGQATVELIALLPLVLLLALAATAVFAWRAADEQAGLAAEAGAIAVTTGDDPRTSARAALPPHAHATIHVHDRTVTVHVHPRLPVAAGLLTAAETAHAGAAP